jgi:hypothetical protein
MLPLTTKLLLPPRPRSCGFERVTNGRSDAVGPFRSEPYLWRHSYTVQSFMALWTTQILLTHGNLL